MSKNFKTLKDNFYAVTKCVLKENLSRNPETLDGYETNLVSTYNELIDYTSLKYPSLSTDDKTTVFTNITHLRTRLLRCFEKLKLNVTIDKNIFSNITGTEPIAETSVASEKLTEDELKTEQTQDNLLTNDIDEDLNELDRTLHHTNDDSSSESETNDDIMEAPKVIEHLSRIFTKGD